MTVCVFLTQVNTDVQPDTVTSASTSYMQPVQQQQHISQLQSSLKELTDATSRLTAQCQQQLQYIAQQSQHGLFFISMICVLIFQSAHCLYHRN